MSSPVQIPVKQKALTIPAKQAQYVVTDVVVQNPGPGEVLVCAEAVGLNIIDAYIQALGMFAEQYPCVTGYEAAGTVVQLGEGVTSLSVGDRVLHPGTVMGDRGTFRQYTIISADLAAKVPQNVSLDAAASVPLCFNTAALGLYTPLGRPGGAGLTPPWEDGGLGKYAGQPIFIFGGTSAVGQYVIQLAKLSGFSPIITTASIKNTDLLKVLGATHVIDRNIPVQELSVAVSSITDVPLKVIYDAVRTPETQNAAYNLLPLGSTLVIATRMLAIDETRITPDQRIATVSAGGIWNDARELAAIMYRHLTSYLGSGEIKPNNVEVLEGGLSGIPAGLQRLMKQGVSACKLIVRPQETI